jgi:hypothetical protein
MVQLGGSSRWFLATVLAVGSCACRAPAESPAAVESRKPADTQHAGITTPHGDHSPHHGGVVLMSGELHYEVVFDRDGRHRLWFSDAVREDLPASVASKVMMIVTRPGASPETLALAIDESGESWIAAGQPVASHDVMVTLTFVARGEPVEIEIPFTSLISK